jgi:hypothetical protein
MSDDNFWKGFTLCAANSIRKVTSYGAIAKALGTADPLEWWVERECRLIIWNDVPARGQWMDY